MELRFEPRLYNFRADAPSPLDHTASCNMVANICEGFIDALISALFALSSSVLTTSP